MNNHHSRLENRKNLQGFTLVETVVAMGIITIMITAFLAAFAPAVSGIKKSISSKEANRLASTLEYELSVLRPNEVTSGGGQYSTSFEKSYNWIKNSGTATKNDAVLLYQYRGELGATPNDDGTLPPFVNADGIPGKDYVLQSVVRRFDNVNVAAELVPRVVEGGVFVVRMRQLIYKTSGELIESTSPGEILNPRGLNEITTYEDYPEAVIAYQAQIFVLKSNQYTYISGAAFDLTTDDNGDDIPDVLGKPIFTRNMAVRR